ncbi:MAG: hypothetical protein ACO3J2_10940 [Chthoniobacterales bacterium]
MFGPRKSERVRPLFPFSFRLWWREVSGPLHRSQHRSLWAAIRRRILLILPAIALLLLLLAWPAMNTFSLWRAHDLAARSLANFERKAYRLAFLQAESAAALQDGLAPVVRARALARTAAADPGALVLFGKLQDMGALTERVLSAWIEAAAVLGTEEELNKAVGALSSAGRGEEVNPWRSRRAFRKGNLADAERHMRTALAEKDTTPLRLELARVLAAIGTPDSIAEATGIVTAAASTPEADKALAFGLKYVKAGPATRRAWADQALRDPAPDNVAVLPAASVMIEDRHWTVDEAVRRLDPVFLGADLDARVAYATWLSERKRPRGEVLRLVDERDAKHSADAFRVRSTAAVEANDWMAVLRLLDAGPPVDPATAQLLRARAEDALNRKALARTSLRRAVRAAADSRTLPAVLAEVDARDEAKLADEVLLEMCGEPSVAEYVLRVARYRFGQRGEPRLTDEAVQRYPARANIIPTVRDYRWRRALLAGESVDPAETGRVGQEEPSNVDFRITHALALLRAGRAAEARLALAPYEPVCHQLFAGQKAVLAAVLAATGSTNEAVELVRTINPQQLTDAEYRLIYSLIATAGESVGR